jgi:hypothetical protein
MLDASEVVATVLVKAEHVVEGFMRINKADFVEGVHEVYNGVVKMAEAVGGSSGVVHTELGAQLAEPVVSAAEAGWGAPGPQVLDAAETPATGDPAPAGKAAKGKAAE